MQTSAHPVVAPAPSVPKYVSTYVCVWVCSCACMYSCMYVRMYVCVYACRYAWMCVCLCVFLFACTYVCTYYVCMHVCVGAFVYACMPVCMYLLCMCVRRHVCSYVRTPNWKMTSQADFLNFFCRQLICKTIMHTNWIQKTLNLLQSWAPEICVFIWITNMFVLFSAYFSGSGLGIKF